LLREWRSSTMLTRARTAGDVHAGHISDSSQSRTPRSLTGQWGQERIGGVPNGSEVDAGGPVAGKHLGSIAVASQPRPFRLTSTCWDRKTSAHVAPRPGATGVGRRPDAAFKPRRPRSAGSGPPPSQTPSSSSSGSQTSPTPLILSALIRIGSAAPVVARVAHTVPVPVACLDWTARAVVRLSGRRRCIVAVKRATCRPVL